MLCQLSSVLLKVLDDQTTHQQISNSDLSSGTHWKWPLFFLQSSAGEKEFVQFIFLINCAITEWTQYTRISGFDMQVQLCVIRMKGSTLFFNNLTATEHVAYKEKKISPKTDPWNTLYFTQNDELTSFFNWDTEHPVWQVRCKPCTPKLIPTQCLSLFICCGH